MHPSTRTTLSGFAAAVAASAVLIPAGSATARDYCGIDVDPTTVVVGTKPVKVTFAVTADCPIDHWKVRLGGIHATPTDAAPTVTLRPRTNAAAGAHRLRVYTYDTDDAKDFGAAFSVLRRTAWRKGTVDASPEPVSKGAKVTVRGRLAVADWHSGRNVAYAKRTVSLEFRRAGTPSFVVVKHVRSDAHGTVRTKAVQQHSGSWRLVYHGNAKAAGTVSPVDFVAVK